MIRAVDCGSDDWRSLLRSRTEAKRDSDLEAVVAKIIEDVRTRGDEALLENGRKFDDEDLSNLEVSNEEKSSASIPPAQEEALRSAYKRIRDFHDAQIERLTKDLEPRGAGWVWKLKGSNLGQRLSALDSVGLYVPGGRANYPSSVLMLAGPAKSARVKKLYVASPCGVGGALSHSVMKALDVAGVDRAFKIGGAAAIAAFAFGTDTVPKVAKVAGPGNKYVTEAKRQLWGTVGIDGAYGPSEVCVVVDRSANPEFAAADLLTQIEHAPDNLGYIVSFGQVPLTRLMQSVRHQLRQAPRREILEACLENALAFVVEGIGQAAEVVNEIAPEHLTISTDDPELLADLVSNAGCILLGDWTPESVADYCLGPSHTLPTGGAARFSSPLNSMDFLKFQSVGRLSRGDCEALTPIVESIAEAEGFPAHGFGATVRGQL